MRVMLLSVIGDWLPWALVGGGAALMVAVVAGAAWSSRRRAAVMRGDGQTMVEVKQMADAVLAELDRKTAELERLIRAADDRLSALRSMETGGRMTEPNHLGKAGRPEQATDFAGSRMDTLTRDICRLAEEGLSPVEIAQRLGQHVGKVELILALRR